MSEPRCYQCGYLLADINAACPQCLPNWNKPVRTDDPPVDWYEQQMISLRAENRALAARVEELEAQRSKWDAYYRYERLQARYERLQASNTQLLACCERALNESARVVPEFREQLKRAIARAKEVHP